MNLALETYDRTVCTVIVGGLVVLHLPVAAQIGWLAAVAFGVWVRSGQARLEAALRA